MASLKQLDLGSQPLPHALPHAWTCSLRHSCLPVPLGTFLTIEMLQSIAPHSYFGGHKWGELYVVEQVFPTSVSGWWSRPALNSSVSSDLAKVYPSCKLSELWASRVT